MSHADDSAHRDGRVTLGVVALSVLALVVRLVGLGTRSFHWDEGRVGYWTLRFLETGAFEYRPVAGGPFLYLVNQPVFALLGPSDFSARLVVALIGGLLPLCALLFRRRLSADETMLFAAVLALSPVLVYHSRFLRGDVPLVAFSLLTLGCLVSLVDTGRHRYLYGAALAGALALTTSAFVVGYLACWVVAGLLVFDHVRIYGDEKQTALDRVSGYGQTLSAWVTPLARAFLLVVAVVIFFFAPRSADGTGPDLWNPLTFPAVLEASLFGSFRKFFGVWVEYRNDHEFLAYLVGHAELLVLLAAPVFVLGLVAFATERYTGGNRPLVAFAGYWAGASLLVFPVITELLAPWVVLHTLAPLSLLAAVGAAKVIGYARTAVEQRNAARTGIAALLLFAVVAQAGAVTASGVYAPSDRDNRMAQYGQPGSDLGAMATNASAAIAGNSGTDVVYVGEQFFLVDESADEDDLPPVQESWGNRLPLPWYFERMDAETASVANASAVDSLDSTPPVVVAQPKYRAELDQRLDGYNVAVYELTLWNSDVVVYVRQ